MLLTIKGGGIGVNNGVAGGRGGRCGARDGIGTDGGALGIPSGRALNGGEPGGGGGGARFLTSPTK